MSALPPGKANAAASTGNVLSSSSSSSSLLSSTPPLVSSSRKKNRSNTSNFKDSSHSSKDGDAAESITVTTLAEDDASGGGSNNNSSKKRNSPYAPWTYEEDMALMRRLIERDSVGKKLGERTMQELELTNVPELSQRSFKAIYNRYNKHLQWRARRLPNTLEWVRDMHEETSTYSSRAELSAASSSVDSFYGKGASSAPSSATSSPPFPSPDKQGSLKRVRLGSSTSAFSAPVKVAGAPSVIPTTVLHSYEHSAFDAPMSQQSKRSIPPALLPMDHKVAGDKKESEGWISSRWSEASAGAGTGAEWEKPFVDLKDEYPRDFNYEEWMIH